MYGYLLRSALPLNALGSDSLDSRCIEIRLLKIARICSSHKFNLSSDQICMQLVLLQSPNLEIQTLDFGLKSIQAQNLHYKQSFDAKL